MYLFVHIRRARLDWRDYKIMGNTRALQALTAPQPTVRQLVIENAAYILFEAGEWPIHRARAIDAIWRVTMSLLDDEIERAWDGTSNWYKSQLLSDVISAAKALYHQIGYAD